jgi:hypothetical protein
MMTRILRPLLWFGLLESKPEGEAGFAVPHVYRKAAVRYPFAEGRLAG